MLCLPYWVLGPISGSHSIPRVPRSSTNAFHHAGSWCQRLRVHCTFFVSFYRLIRDHPCKFSFLAPFLFPVLVLLVFSFRSTGFCTIFVIYSFHRTTLEERS